MFSIFRRFSSHSGRLYIQSLCHIFCAILLIRAFIATLFLIGSVSIVLFYATFIAALSLPNKHFSNATALGTRPQLLSITPVPLACFVQRKPVSPTDGILRSVTLLRTLESPFLLRFRYFQFRVPKIVHALASSHYSPILGFSQQTL